MKVEPEKLYRHYKNGKLYKVLYLANHTETGEEVVVYEGQYDDPEFGHHPVWVRPKEMFEEKVMFNDKEVDRFAEVHIK
jgi:hypothetical protein